MIGPDDLAQTDLDAGEAGTSPGVHVDGVGAAPGILDREDAADHLDVAGNLRDAVALTGRLYHVTALEEVAGLSLREGCTSCEDEDCQGQHGEVEVSGLTHGCLLCCVLVVGLKLLAFIFQTRKIIRGACVVHFYYTE